jgi:hypothetical protein
VKHPYDEGRMARFDGRDREAPSGADPGDAQTWLAGWDSAQVELELAAAHHGLVRLGFLGCFPAADWW